MVYYELDNVIYRGADAKSGPTEMAVAGKWVPGFECTEARLHGAMMDEAKAREFAGDDWPADTAGDDSKVKATEKA